jgi:hypothetical protein
MYTPILRIKQKGITTIFVLVFGSVLGMVIAGMVWLTILQSKVTAQTLDREQGLALAESGLNYYKWFLAHFPTDVRNGTGQPGPYVVSYTDPITGISGTYTLTITGQYQCNELVAVDVVSVGQVTNKPNSRRTITARFSYPSVSEYSAIGNSDVTYGSGSTTTGSVHSNGIITMNGTHNSYITSAVSSQGVRTTNNGGTPGLWVYPVAPVSFSSLLNISQMQTRAQTYGQYFGRYSSGTSGEASERGYHIIFKNNGTYDVYQVSDMDPADTLDPSNGTDYHKIAAGGETFLGNYTPVSSCSLIFVRDKVWVEGVVSGKVTLVAADPDTDRNRDIIIRNNLTRKTTTGSDGVALIAERHILLSSDSPNNLTWEGIFVASGGYVRRNKYKSSLSTSVRSSMTRVGTGVTAQEGGGFYWSTNPGPESGYTSRTYVYDRALVFSPPPFTPTISSQYRIINWREN